MNGDDEIQVAIGTTTSIEPTTGPATRQTVGARWDELAEYAECRVWRHTWKPYTAKEHRVRNGRTWFSVIRICGRCGVKRHMELDSRGSVVHSHYEYPPDYVLKGVGGIHGEAMDELRLRQILNVGTQVIEVSDDIDNETEVKQ